jgi:hypothetical protein
MATQLPLNVAFERCVRERWGNNPKPYEINAAAETLRQAFAQGELVVTVYNAKNNREIELSATLWRVFHSDEVYPLVLSFFSSFSELPLWHGGPYSWLHITHRQRQVRGLAERPGIRLAASA